MGVLGFLPWIGRRQEATEEPPPGKAVVEGRVASRAGSAAARGQALKANPTQRGIEIGREILKQREAQKETVLGSVKPGAVCRVALDGRRSLRARGNFVVVAEVDQGVAVAYPLVDEKTIRIKAPGQVRLPGTAVGLNRTVAALTYNEHRIPIDIDHFRLDDLNPRAMDRQSLFRNPVIAQLDVHSEHFRRIRTAASGRHEAGATERGKIIDQRLRARDAGLAR